MADRADFELVLPASRIDCGSLTLLLRDRESPNVVSERLGHASVTVTLSIYAHVLPGDQKAAAARFAALVRGAES